MRVIGSGPGERTGLTLGRFLRKKKKQEGGPRKIVSSVFFTWTSFRLPCRPLGIFVPANSTRASPLTSDTH